jgi:hypothetical protein
LQSNIIVWQALGHASVAVTEGYLRSLRAEGEDCLSEVIGLNPQDTRTLGVLVSFSADDAASDRHTESKEST